MTLKERLDKANQDSVALYLRRQQIESQKQQVQRMGFECDQQLVGLDAQIGMLTEMIAEEEAAAKKAGAQPNGE